MCLRNSMFYSYVLIYCSCLKSKFNFLSIEEIGFLSEIFIVNFNFLMKSLPVLMADFIFLAKGFYHLNCIIHYLLSAHIKKALLSVNVY